MKSFFPGLGLLAGALAFSTCESSATIYPAVAFSTLGAGGGYQQAGVDISGSGSQPGYQGYGNEFAPTVSGQLDNIAIAISYLNQPELVNVQLRLDGGNGYLPTGPILASGTVMTDQYLGANTTLLATFNPSTPVFLTASTDYWLLLTPSSGTSFDSWNFSSTTMLGNHVASPDGSTWDIGPNQVLNAFQVTLTAPEPSYLTFALGGLVLFAARRQIFRATC